MYIYTTQTAFALPFESMRFLIAFIFAHGAWLDAMNGSHRPLSVYFASNTICFASSELPFQRPQCSWKVDSTISMPNHSLKANPASFSRESTAFLTYTKPARISVA